MAAQIMIEVAPGELIDKITILEIKLENMTDAAKLANVRHELDVLAAARDAAISASDDLAYLTGELKRVNTALWQIEDDIRDCERANDFGENFIDLARAVYKTNDLRAALKRKINELLDSPIFEEKSYAPY